MQTETSKGREIICRDCGCEGNTANSYPMIAHDTTKNYAGGTHLVYDFLPTQAQWQAIAKVAEQSAEVCS